LLQKKIVYISRHKRQKIQSHVLQSNCAALGSNTKWERMRSKASPQTDSYIYVMCYLHPNQHRNINFLFLFNNSSQMKTMEKDKVAKNTKAVN